MDKKKLLMTAAILSVMNTGMMEESQASGSHNKNGTKCKGVATKWVNDCSANGHGCGGQAKVNFDKEEWLSMTKDDCEAVKEALKNQAVRKYLERIQKGTAEAVKNGKKV
jgi:uncharacterized membrane protein